MSFTLPPILVYTASWFGMMGGVWALFDRAEKVATPQVKEQISNWLFSAQVPDKDSWPTTFESLADHLFGKKLLSLRSALISALLSSMSIGLLIPIWYFVRTEDFYTCIQTFGLFFFVLMVLIIGGMFNVVQDYLSVIQTRYLLRRMAQRARLIKQLTILVVDFVLTSTIIWVTLIIHLTYLWTDDTFVGPSEAFIRSLQFRPITTTGEGPSLGMFFYSTYLTSAWMWLYVLSGVMVRLLHVLNWPFKIVRRFLNIRDNPLQSLGFVSMVLVTVLYLIVPFLGIS